MKKSRKIAILLLCLCLICISIVAFVFCRDKENDSNDQGNNTVGNNSNDQNEDIKGSEGLEYTLCDDGTYYEVSDGEKNDYTDVVIPNKHNNLPVTTIGDYAFGRFKTLLSVTIPDGVTTIGYSVFYGCTSLTTVTIPDSVTSVSKDAFEDCTNLEYNEYDNAYYLGNEKNPYVVLMKAKSNDITSCIIPNGTKVIHYEAFSGCTSLTTVTIPDSVTSVGEDAFKDCTNLEYNEYDNAYYLGNEKNPYVVLMKTKSKDITSCIVHNDTKVIHYCALSGCTSLTSINIPDSVTSIGESAFDSCTALERIYFNATAMNDRYRGPYAIGICDDAGKKGNGIKVVIGKNVTKIPGYLFCAKNSHNGYPTNPPKITSIEFEENSICKKIGTHAFNDCEELSSITIPNTVTSIGCGAFNGCSSLASITIPNSVTSIGTAVFSGCLSLTSITIPDSVTSIGDSVFFNCIGLTSITIPDSVTSIGESAFDSCSSLTSISIPDSVTSIGESAFDSCSKLKKVYITDLTAWCKISFNSYYSTPLYNGTNLYLNGELVTNLVIPNTITEIKKYAFCGCVSLTSVSIPDSVTSIGYSAFRGCSSLTSITIPNGITFISVTTFSGCSSLSSITIPHSVTSIEYGAFNGCSNLANITIPNSVTEIGEKAFSGCSSLTSVSIPDSVTSIGYSAFRGCSSLTSVNIPDSVTSISSSAFSGCTNLTSITIPDSVTSIGVCAFEGCSSLANITIPNSVTSISGEAFSGCASLTSITIPDSVTSIGDSVFFNCIGLTSITVDGNNTLYMSIDGNLYTKDGKTLIQYAIGKTNSEFSIPNGVVDIRADALRYCTNLKSIIIPQSITSIGHSAFRDCSSLTNIFYKGTKKDWNSISLSYYNNLEDIARYYYSETAPKEEGNFWHYDENGNIAIWE